MEIKPCPFCGNDDIDPLLLIEIIIGTNRKSQIYTCLECGCQLETNEKGLKNSQWNDRAETPNE